VNVGAFFVRWRVRLGYPLAIAVLLFAQPTLRSILWGTVVGAIGLWLRGFAAGYLHKQEILTVTGPYAYTRNPLYLGSAILALGTGIATHSWISAAILFSYFVLFYSVVTRREEKELHLRHGAAFEEYARAVPLFFPRLMAVKLPGASAGAFSLLQYKKNHEWQAAVGFLLLLIALFAIWAFRPR
jgi:protein-S-isoprenylcysteine O-methyltransferase Ste14